MTTQDTSLPAVQGPAMTASELADLYGINTSEAPQLARVSINKDPVVEDESGNDLVVPAPSLKFRPPQGEDVYAKDVSIQVYYSTMQSSVWDNDSEKFTNMSSHFTSWRDNALDWHGGDKCGWISSKEREKLKDVDPIAYSNAKAVKLSRHLFGLITMKDDKGKVLIDSEPFRMKLSPSNFQGIDNTLKSIFKGHSINPASVPLAISYQRQKAGSNTYYVLGYKPDYGNIVQLDSDYNILVDDFRSVVEYENNQIIEKMRENAEYHAEDDLGDVIDQ